MKSQIVVELTPSPLERVESDLAVAGFFTDERPLRGGIARVDWRLCGGLSKRVELGDLDGRSGEAMLMGCGRALRSPRLLVVGLGNRRDFDLVRMSDETENAMRRCLGLRCLEIAFAPLGVAADDVPRHVPAIVAGIRSATLDAGVRLRIHFCVSGSEIPAIQRAFTDALRAARAEEFELRAPEPGRAPAPRPLASAARPPG